MSGSIIVSASRTPIGSFLGGLSSLAAPELGSIAIKDCLDKVSYAGEICEVIMGNVLQAGVGQAPARQAALGAGLSHSTPCVTINKVCGSGLKTVMMADQAIRAGDAELIVAGGMESMSQAPHLTHAVRKGSKLGDIQLLDAMVFDGLTCAFEKCHMGSHAEHIAAKYNVSRQDQDEFAAQSQQRASSAVENGRFVEEMVPVTLRDRKGNETVLAHDECVRGDSTAESLSKLRPVFQKDGSVTAGNASTLSDGAAAVVVVSEEKAAEIDSPLRTRIVSSFTSGTEPQDLFIAPVLAVEGVLKKAGVSASDVDYFEINEAFASQMVACTNELGIDAAKVNVNGGGISLGHPIGASGARCLVTLLHVLQQNKAKLGVVSLCLGGGNAVAMLVENMVV